MAGDTFDIIEFNNNTSPYISDTNLNLMQTRIDGGIKNVDDKVEALQEQKSAQLSTAGWYRVAKINGTGHPARTAIFSVSTVYNYTSPNSALIAITTTYQKAKITQLNSISENVNQLVITKIRILYDEDEKCFYVDTYYAVNTVNDLFVKNESLIQDNNLELVTPVVETYTSNQVDILIVNYNKKEPYYENLSSYFINNWVADGTSIIEVDELGLKHITVSITNGTNTNAIQLPEDLRPSNTVILNASNQTASGYVMIDTSGIISVSSNIFTSGSSNLIFSGVYK